MSDYPGRNTRSKKTASTSSSSTEESRKFGKPINRKETTNQEPAEALDDELADLVRLMKITPKSGAAESVPTSVFYYGWFFGASISNSLKQIADKYMQLCYASCPSFQRFLKCNSSKASICDPLSYYLKPASTSKSGRCHVTAKFCGREPFIAYAHSVNSFIGKEFDLHIVGIFFTQSTYGFRIKLTKDQEPLFGDERSESVQLRNHYTKSTKLNQNSNNALKLDEKEKDDQTHSETEYYGVYQKRQNLDFKPSSSRAHITMGCAPGVKPIQAGLDLLDIISLENQKNVSCCDTDIEGGILRQYGRGNGDAFVVYMDFQYITKAVFMSVP